MANNTCRVHMRLNSVGVICVRSEGQSRGAGFQLLTLPLGDSYLFCASFLPAYRNIFRATVSREIQ
jgi:hypothetical protein